MSELPSSTLSEPPTMSVAVGQYQDQALTMVLLTASVATSLTTAGIFMRDGLGATTQVALALSVALWSLWPLHRSRHRRWVAYLLIVALWSGSVGAILAQGSVRSGGSLAMLATLVLAGSFLQRTATLVVAVISLTSLAVINLLEQAGNLTGRLPPVDFAVWALQATCIVTTLVSLLYSRFRLLEAFRDQKGAYDLAVAAERDMRASQERFLSLFENNPAATLVLSLDTRLVVNANVALKKLLGYAPEQLLGNEPPQFWTNPSEHLAFRAMLKAQGRITNLRASLRKQDGSLIDAVVFANVVQQDHERLLMIMALDVSAEEKSRQELKLSEERFSKAFNFSPLGMTITRLSDGLFVEANAANERVIGWSQHDLRGRTSLDVGVWLNAQDRNDYVSTLQRDGTAAGIRNTHAQQARRGGAGQGLGRADTHCRRALRAVLHPECGRRKASAGNPDQPGRGCVLAHRRGLLPVAGRASGHGRWRAGGGGGRAERPAGCRHTGFVVRRPAAAQPPAVADPHHLQPLDWRR
jgi:PAS domain S-box-containing protein